MSINHDDLAGECSGCFHWRGLTKTSGECAVANEPEFLTKLETWIKDEKGIIRKTAQCNDRPIITTLVTSKDYSCNQWEPRPKGSKGE